MIGAPVIYGPDNRPVNAERVKLEKQTRFNALRNWTPEILVRQLEAFCRGEIAALAWVMEWLEKHDDIIATVAPKAKAAVSRHGYDVLPVDEIKPEQKQAAEDQQGFMQEFFQNLTASDAVELEESGGMRLLIQQIMDAYGKSYAAHHIIWKPSRKGLGAELVKVPTWFFEATEGRLKFLPGIGAQRGVELETLGGRDAWMVSKGRGVMLAGVVAAMLKRIPLQDLLTYCDRHGMPMFLGKTAAAQGTQGWTDMASAVAGMGAEYGAVINTGDAIEVINLAGSSGTLPYTGLIDRMDKAQIMLWRGGDLSTMSQKDSTGSNPQQEDTDELDADNAAWVSETINRNLTARAIAWKFGKAAPVLVKVVLRTKTRDNLTQDISVVKEAKEMGVRIKASWFTNKFGIVEADPDETALGETPKPQVQAIPEEVNALNTSPDTKELFAKSLAKAVGVSDRTLDPVRPVMERLAAGVQDGGMSDAEWLQGFEELALELPEFFNPLLAAEMAEELEGAMGTAIVNGVRQSLISKNTPTKEA